MPFDLSLLRQPKVHKMHLTVLRKPRSGAITGFARGRCECSRGLFHLSDGEAVEGGAMAS